jgi:NADH-quinone oxidoreductase subunit J
MLTETPDQAKKTDKPGLRLFLAAGAGLAALSCAFNFVYLTEWGPALSRTGDFSIIAAGKRLLTEYCLVFEMISLVLLFAIIGSIILARGGRGN